MNGQPTAAQKRWHNWVREQDCNICFTWCAIHHIKGARAKLKGVKGFGEWYILNLCHKHHQGDVGIHTNKKAFERKWGTQKSLWTELIEEYEQQCGQKPMSEEEYQIIVERA